MSGTVRNNRRGFLTTAAATLAIPMILPRSVRGANEKVVTGHIGVRNQGTPNLRAFLKLATPAAVCDVDTEVLAAGAKLMEKTGVSQAVTARDYRELLDRKDLDAVVITTPDHWHALMTIHACQAGKDVYCEKPLSLTIAEGREMVEAARRHQRVVQTGSQQRSDDRFRQACEFVRNGRLGKIKTVLVGIPKVNLTDAPVPDSDAPSALNFERWLGPAPLRAYNAQRVHYNFRFYWDYSGGQMTNFGAHHLDIAQWALGRDDSGPVHTEGTATFNPAWYEVTSTCRVTHTYDDGITVVVGQEQKDIPGGVTFVGSEGTLFVDRSKIVAQPGELLKAPRLASDVRLEVSKNHHQNFLDCVKSRQRPIADVAIGHRSATVCHLGNIAVRLGRAVRWNPKTEQFNDDVAANAMLSRPYRKPYHV